MNFLKLPKKPHKKSNKRKTLIRLKIQKHDENHIELSALNRIEHHGFGTFLIDLKPEEVECDEFSKQALLAATEKGGLNGMEIFDNNILSWGSPEEDIIMPISEISNACNKDGWLSKIVTT